MTIALRGTGQQGTAQNGSDVTLTFDVAPLEGDVVVLVGGHANNGTGEAFGPVTGGYTPIATVSGDLLKQGAWYKVMGVTPDATVVGGGGGNAAHGVVYGAYVLSGVDTATVLDQTPVVVGDGTALGSKDPGAIVTQTAGAWVLVLGGTSGLDTPGAGPSGYSSLLIGAGNDNNDCAFGAAVKEVATPGTEDPGTFSSFTDGAANIALTIAIKPAPTGRLLTRLMTDGLLAGRS